MAVCQNLVPLVNIKIAGKWMFIPLKMVLIGIDPYPYDPQYEDFHPDFHKVPDLQIAPPLSSAGDAIGAQDTWSRWDSQGHVE